MTTTEIILTIISSSILSAILTSVVNWKLHNSNYKKDYYKKILDKRLESVEKVQILTGKLSFLTQLDNSVIPSFCFNEKFYTDFIFLLATTIDSSYWLDSKTSTKLTELNVYLLNNFSNNIDNNWNEESITEKYQELGEVHSEIIRTYRKELQAMINLELKSLYKIDLFFKDKKKKDNSLFPVNKSNYNN